MIRVGLNGFGRIGRAITRIITNSKDINLFVLFNILLSQKPLLKT
jgi:glyceraldehyde-3-phosphate dehydrogenase/erythrose-4-phosphate dehydrogenase